MTLTEAFYDVLASEFEDRDTLENPASYDQELAEIERIERELDLK